MAGMQEQYDSALLGILQNEGQIAKFLNVIYGFLYRRTDFYLQMKERTDKLGFPPGIALKLSVGAFKKYEEMASKDEERRQAKRRQQEEDLQRQLKEIHTQEQENETEEPMDTESVPQAPVGQVEEPGTQPEETPQPAGQDEQNEPASSPKDNTPQAESVPSVDKASQSVQEAQPEKTENDAKKEKGAAKSGNEEEDDNPELTKLQKKFQEDPDSYNGAQRDNYSWSQSITDVDVQVKVPKQVRKGCDVRVTIAKKRLRACHRGTDGSWVTVVDDALTWDIQKEESMWSLVPGEHIHINLEKVQERWWEAVLEGEPHISVRKIDPSRPLTDLDDEAQAKIEEMMYNEHQKKLGKPQSQEQKVHTMLKQAWNAEGSPFKGQPFDPSKVNISSGDASNLMGAMGQLPTAK